jgi:5'-methylthioadenosine phosphorylase
MTAMPEAKLAREAEISYALVALVTDFDCWRKVGKKGPAVKQGTAPPPELDPAVLLKEIIANLQAASDNAMTLIRRVVQRIARNPHEVLDPPAAQALKLAIWSDKTKIPAEEVERLRPLWVKYFGN